MSNVVNFPVKAPNSEPSYSETTQAYIDAIMSLFVASQGLGAADEFIVALIECISTLTNED